MIVVKVELHNANNGEISEIGRAIIFNDGSGTAERGNYGVRIGRKGNTLNAAILSHPQKQAKVLDYPRQSYTVWELVRRSLNAVYT